LHLGLITDNAGLKDDTIFNYSKNDIGVYISFLEKILEKNKNIDYDSVFDAGMTLLRKYSNQGVVYYPLRAAVKEYIAGKYDGFLKEAFDRFYDEQCEDPFIFIERTHYKRLKKIPPDLVAYIRLEGESCKSNNDKMMIISYAYGKIELIEWYIELLDTGDKKYFVPHSKEYLVSMRTQILAAIKYIMDIKIDQNRPLIDIKYPKGYEG
jgi:hypothetical protein